MKPEDADILQRLSAPFRSDEVQFKIQTNPKDTDKEPFAMVVAYVDARAVSARLNEVAGLQWSSEFMPSATGNGVECRLTVLGSRRADVGTESKQDADKGGYSDALKRAAVHFGIGAYLYDFPAVKARVERFGKGWYLTREAKAELAQLVQAIHDGARTLPRFNHIRVRDYRPIFDVQASAGAPAPTAAPARPSHIMDDDDEPTGIGDDLGTGDTRTPGNNRRVRRPALQVVEAGGNGGDLSAYWSKWYKGLERASDIGLTVDPLPETATAQEIVEASKALAGRIRDRVRELHHRAAEFNEDAGELPADDATIDAWVEHGVTVMGVLKDVIPF